MLAETYSKELRRWIQRVRLPSAYCQSCLSDKSPDRDFIYTCELCQGSIHNKHYGREIEDPREQMIEKWYCERCRMICEYLKQQKYAEIEAMKCHFCPKVKGILKRIIFNQTQTIWLHPECSTWLYPIVSHKNGRKIQFTSEYPTKPTGKFWVDLQRQTQAPCEICKESKGFKLKCMYYTCQKYYHCSCAKTIGLIRDLESMRFDNSETYIPPYCEEHLMKRISDCEAKANKYKQLKNEEGKASHFTQMIATYTVQLKNMQKSAKKYEEEQKIRKQMEYQVGQNEDIMQDLSFQQGQSYQSHHPAEFYQFIFDAEYPKRSRPTTRRPSFLQSHPSKYQTQSATVQSNDKKDTLPNTNNIESSMCMLLKKVSQNRVGKLIERQSQPQQSQWNSSQQAQQQDD